jgi:hypothetical protein
MSSGGLLAATLGSCTSHGRGIVIFIIGSIAWMIDGWLESKASLSSRNWSSSPDQRPRGLALAPESRKRYALAVSSLASRWEQNGLAGHRLSHAAQT